ncbi:hypothetical protein VL10_20685 [Leclercia adecarboxylata]|nr:hypothetical protein VL10_20685 [Leclercia adecarboxylata]KMN64130.1 hypothetical protein VK95_16590 [Leclercia sp. LK8]
MTLPLEPIIRNGVEASKAISSQLENYVLESRAPNLEALSQFCATFDSSLTDNNLLTFHGDALGIGLEIMDAAGNCMQPRSVRLDYSLSGVGNHQRL